MIPTHLVVGPNEPDNLEFGRLLEEFRLKVDLTRRKAADILGVSSEYVRLIERGQRTPALGNMPTLMRMYSVNYSAHVNGGLIDLGPSGQIFVEFTSRIRERRDPNDPPVLRDNSSSNRTMLIGQVVSLCVSADTETLRQIYRTLLRS